jgi:acetyl esterase
MALDPQAAQLLESMAEAMPPIETMTPAQARVASQKLAALLPKTTPRSHVSERVVAVDGGEVRVRIYTPPGDIVLPVFLYIHGGGWVIGGEIEMFDPLCDQIAIDARCVVASLAYRLAPEHPFPTPLDDCLEVADWLVSEAAALGIDPSRFAIGGDSSGGNLAAALALRARDRGRPQLCFQLLVYPPTRCVRHRDEYLDGLDVAVLTRQGMAWYWQHYVPSTVDPSDPYVSPLLAPDLAGLPPTLMITAEYDVLRDEAQAFARRLQEAAVPVVLRHYDDMFHGFIGFSDFLPQAREAVGTAVASVHDALHPRPTAATATL